MSKGNLAMAKKAKNDEFYTKLTDIEKECFHYRDQFRGKTIYCNCDDPEESKFWVYFSKNFEFFGLKKLISTHYSQYENQAYKLEIFKDINNDNKVDEFDMVKTQLEGNGDFRSEECIQLLEEADIVITNPPFSLFREYVALLMKYDKKFLIVGSMNAITYKDIFKHIKDNKLWLGFNMVKEFMQPDGTIKKFGNINWYTNLDNNKRNEKLILFRTYKDNKENYSKYDNYDAINIDKVVDIPVDYDGVMGVPITFLTKYNPDQFEIIKFRKGNDDKDLCINGKCPYFRILIKRKEL